ncbi:hypothetical protein HYH02_011899 [Chlamydomonas schloesseri]|uniref:Protein kinase domain-containing protein n=1 Tax=Chlamydomonas schloesseri TaxID=2026947 RepID=A0A835SYQ1_9CHLO|nr:hypothetical protein HYH02_011899 [Chlamydomonas schloesseri]|eukprot:KAG2435608.1 hypothetical protein HYH02_011899 [Chlamydomonas schloesseri]
MLAHPYLVQTFEYGLCQLDSSFEGLRSRALGSIFGLSDLCAASPPQQQPTGGLTLGASSRGNIAAGVTDTAASAAYSEEQFSVLATPDSFDGPNAPEPVLPTRPVDCVDVLKQLGAAPGKYVVQIVSEWCDEGTLHAAIRKGVFKANPQHRRSRTWALRALLRTAREVALGMCHLHSINIIHGDLKPGNVLLKSSRVDSRGFVAKVADFGLSRLLPATADGEGQYVPTSEWATVAYMAGEYLDNKLCKSSDVYSFGVLLWQMFTGKAPFAGHHEAQVAVGVMTGSLHLEWPPNMPPPLARLGQACCRHEPEQRPTFKECIVALAGIEAQVREAAANAKQRFATISASASQRGIALLGASSSSGAVFGPSTLPTGASALDMSLGATGGAQGPASSAAVFGAGAGPAHVGYSSSCNNYGYLNFPSGFTSVGPVPYAHVATATAFVSAGCEDANATANANAASANAPQALQQAGAMQYPQQQQQQMYAPYLYQQPYMHIVHHHHHAAAPQQQQQQHVPLRTCFSMEQPSSMMMGYGGAAGGAAAAGAAGAAVSSTVGGVLDSAANAEPPLFMSLAHSAANLMHVAASASRSTLCTMPGEDGGPATATGAASLRTPLPQTPHGGAGSLEAAGSGLSDAAVLVDGAGQAGAGVPAVAAIDASTACAAAPAAAESSMAFSVGSAALMPAGFLHNGIFANLPDDASAGTNHAQGGVQGPAAAMAAAATAAAAARAAGNAAAAAAAMSADDAITGRAGAANSSGTTPSPAANGGGSNTVRPALHFNRPDIGFDCAPSAAAPVPVPAAASAPSARAGSASTSAAAFRSANGVAPNVLGLPPSPLLGEPWVQSPIAGGGLGRLEQRLQGHSSFVSYADIAQQSAALFMAGGSTGGGDYSLMPTSEPSCAAATSAHGGGGGGGAATGATAAAAAARSGRAAQLPSAGLSSASAASCGTAGTALTTGIMTTYGGGAGSTALGSSMIWSASMYGTSPPLHGMMRDTHALPFYQAGAAGALAVAAAGAAAAGSASSATSANVSSSCHAPVIPATTAPSTAPVQQPTQGQTQPQTPQTPHTPPPQALHAPQAPQQRPLAPAVPPFARLYASAGPATDRQSSVPVPAAGAAATASLGAAGPAASNTSSAAAAILSNAAAAGPYGSPGSNCGNGGGGGGMAAGAARGGIYAAAAAAASSPGATPSPTPTHLGAAAATGYYCGSSLSERLMSHRSGGRYGESPGNLFSVPEVNSGSCDGFNAPSFGALCGTRAANGSGGGDGGSSGGGGGQRALAGVPSPKRAPTGMQMHQMHVQMHMQMHQQHLQQQQVTMQHAAMQQAVAMHHYQQQQPQYVQPYPPSAFSPMHAAGRLFPGSFGMPAAPAAGSSPYASGGGTAGSANTTEPQNSGSAAAAAAAALQPQPQSQGATAGTVAGNGSGSGGGFGYRTLPGYNSNGAWSTVRKLPVPPQYLGAAPGSAGGSGGGANGGMGGSAGGTGGGLLSAVPMPMLMHSMGSGRRGSSGMMLQHVPEDDGDGGIGL